MTIPNKVSEYSRYAAQEFLQTVIFVDDRIYSEKNVMREPSNVTLPKKRKKVTKAQNQQLKAITFTENNDEQEVYSPHDIVNSFAKKQIICSLYQPDRRAKVTQTSDIFPLCMAADVVIVDWDLYGDSGEKTLELIDGLIKQAVSAVPEQLRLILVYSQEQNLFAIADKIFTKVTSSIGEQFEPIDEENGLAFYTKNTRLSIIGKSGRERPDTPPEHIVNEKDIANVVVDEFSKLASGLLHAVSLLGLAEIRKNSRKILSKFSSSLDPAFLTHRALSLPHEDATRHLIPLLISEIEAVLEDKLDEPIINKSLIEDWCHNVWNPGKHVEELLNSATNIRDIAADFCIKGIEMRVGHESIPIIKKSMKSGSWSKDPGCIREITSLLAKDRNSIENQEFSRLMSSRTFYKNDAKSLQLGSIIYIEENEKTKKHLLCLMPVCDCVRLGGNRRFVFVELIESTQDGKNKASIVISLKDNSFVELIFKPKPYNVYIAEFSPDNHKKQVLTKKNEKAQDIFEDIAKQKYVWADQLKTAHAQRAVEQFARELSRVGLTESEWQRLLDK
jgi:hypothetical protein